MSNDNVSLVRRFYEAKGDPAVVVQVMSTDVVWDIAPGFPGGGTYTGLTSVVGDFLAPLAARFTSFGAKPDALIADGDKVIALGHYVGTSLSGTTFTARFVHVWTVAGGLITRHYQVADSAIVASFIDA